MICETASQVYIKQLRKKNCDPSFIFGLWVRIERTPCHLGGYRYWFLCPSCSRRCAILYPHNCRKCVNGRYFKELLSPRHRKISKAISLRRRLGQTTGGIIAPFPDKPKLMRWHTYLALRTESLALENEIWAAEHALQFGSVY